MYEIQHRRAEQLSLINQVARDVTSILDLDQLLEQVAQTIRLTFNAYHAMILLLERETHTLVLRAAAGAPPEALIPLMRRTIENGFELTGPIARGDQGTIEAHLTAIREHAPQLESLYRHFAALTRP